MREAGASRYRLPVSSWEVLYPTNKYQTPFFTQPFTQQLCETYYSMLPLPARAA
ncbi:hypothetical protein SAMN04488069_110159 [Hymenobacter psychrophilus]|uniref:Uncharacterized protein n=1 Tax=Hymenobacter psychrophilus TaxID=651662 RepID=A0A1H3LAR2_9BACT|nr:hypothetical protein SAMN04488069_110159 [Hymenobacter psychrophilus]